jgi:prolyl oligopeptidase
MNRISILGLVLAAGLFTEGFCQQKPISAPTYPSTKKIDQSDEYFGTRVKDPYRWLEEDPSRETASWVESQNKTSLEYLEKIPYRKGMKEKWTETSNYFRMSIPEKSGDYIYYLFNPGSLPQDVLIRANVNEIKGDVIIDPNTFSPGKKQSITNFKVSKDGKYIAYSLSEEGSPMGKICFYDTHKRKNIEDVIDGILYPDFSWKGKGIYYSQCRNYSQDQVGFNIDEFQEIKYHMMGTPPQEDLILTSQLEYQNRYYSVKVSDDERFLIVKGIESAAGNALAVYIGKPEIEFTFQVPTVNHTWDFIGIMNDSLILRTNYKAENYRLVLADPYNIDTNSLKVLIPEDQSMVMVNAASANKNIMVSYLKSASSSLKIFTSNGKLLKTLELPAAGTVKSLRGWNESSTFYFSFSSFTYPETVYAYSVGSNQIMPLLENFAVDQGKYKVEQVSYTSFDQTSIPMFIVYRQGTNLNGNNPTLLYGAGCLNNYNTPSFDISRFIFLENGGILAVPSIRGGGDFGEKWHQAGIKEKKQVSINDFIAAAQYLFDHSYTSPGKLAIQNEVDGDVLVSACLTQRPEMFKVGLINNGITDMLRYHLLSANWLLRGDYGTSESESAFIYLYKYSPLQAVRNGTSYPAVFITALEHDKLYSPAHSYKFVAALQEMNQGGNPLLLRTYPKQDQNVALSAASKAEIRSDALSFLFYNLGLQFQYLGQVNDKVKDKKTAKKPDYINNPVYRMNAPKRSTTEKPQKPEQQEAAPKK